MSVIERAASRPAIVLDSVFGQAGGDRGSRLRWFVLLSATLTCVALSPHAGRSPGSIIVPMAAVLLAAAISSIAGFAFSAICGAMLFHLLPNRLEVVQIMLLCSIASQASMTWSLRQHLNWSALAVFLAGGAIGLPVGVWLLLHAGPAHYFAGFGVLLIGYGTWMLFRRPAGPRRGNRALDMLIGALGGITGGTAAFPGAPVTIWCGLSGWDKARQRALVQPFILFMQIAALITISLVRGGAAVSPGFAGLLFVPASLLGTMLGMSLFGRLSDLQFARIVNLLLIVSGVSYIL